MRSQKQVEASRDGKNRKETVKQTEDDLSNEELKLSGEESSMSQISIETASLLLAMKLLKMVPPDFCIQPPSPHSPSSASPSLEVDLPPFSHSSIKESSVSSPTHISSSSNRSIYNNHIPYPLILFLCLHLPSPLLHITNLPQVHLRYSSSCKSDANPLPLALKLMNVIPPSFSYDTEHQ